MIRADSGGSSIRDRVSRKMLELLDTSKENRGRRSGVMARHSQDRKCIDIIAS
jgi:hypothetical protein